MKKIWIWYYLFVGVTTAVILFSGSCNTDCAALQKTADEAAMKIYPSAEKGTTRAVCLCKTDTKAENEQGCLVFHEDKILKIWCTISSCKLE